MAVDIIKYNGKPNVLAWKYTKDDKPEEFLRMGTQVIVNESQEVVFVKSGKIFDVLGPGRHTLSTMNIPLLSKFINIPFGGQSPFSAEIWYINKTYALDVKWGTAPAIQLQDPKFNVFIPVTAHGQFGIQVDDSKAFLKKLVGTLPSFEQDAIIKYFRGLLVSNVKNVVSEYLIKKNISILEVNAYISEISNSLKEKVSPELAEYGIKLANFYVTAIEAQEGDSAVLKLKDALSKRAEMDIVGYDYNTEKSFNVLENVSKNEGNSSAIMNTGLGLGMGLGVSGKFKNQFENISTKLNTETKEKDILKCTKCGAEVEEGQKFCPECGNKVGITCIKCGVNLKHKVKFCPECGASQIITCPKCNKEISEEFKFCPECGEKI